MSKDIWQEFRDGKLDLGEVVKLMILDISRKQLSLAESGYVDREHMLLLGIWLELNAIRCLMQEKKEGDS